jgi:hypothetical protein
VFIPLPNGDMVWQCHCPISVMQEKGLGFDPVKAESAACAVGEQQQQQQAMGCHMLSAGK